MPGIIYYKMRNTLLICAIVQTLILNLHNSYAQSLTQTIRGKIIDKQSKVPLPGANVVLMGDSAQPITGVATDADGYFRIENVKIGRVGLQISFIGYNTITMNNLSLTSGKELVLNVELEEMVIMTKEVEIISQEEKDKPNNDMTTVSARVFSVEESQRYAGSMNDVARMASNFAGAQSANDTRNDIVIRGNSPLGVLYRLEGIDIPNPSHFSIWGTNGGPVSILNNNVLSNSDFMTGAFPAEYGNVLSGVFDLKMRNGNNEKHEFVGQAGFNGAELLAEGPLSRKNKLSYLVSYRYNNLELFKIMNVDIGTEAVPTYQDISFKLHWQHKHGTTSLFGIGGASYIEMLDSEIDTSNNVYGHYGEDMVFGSGMYVSGLQHTHIINPKTYIKYVFSANGSQNKIINDSLSSLDKHKVPFYRNNSIMNRLASHLVLNKKFSAQHNMRIGIMHDRFFFNVSDSVYRAEIDRFIILSDFNGQSDMVRPYFQWQYKASNELTFNSGVHFNYFVLNNSNSLEPRAGMKYQLSNIDAINLGYGFHSQTQPLLLYFEQELTPDSSAYVTPNRNIGMTKSHHFVIGYDRMLAENTRFKTEAYYQYVFDAPVDIKPNYFSMLNEGAGLEGVFFPDTLVNKGTGKNYGMEFTLERFLGKGLYYLFTLSLYESKYKGSDEVEHNTSFNGNYVFNALAGKEILLFKNKDESKKTKQVILNMDARFAFIGGKYYTPVDLEKSKLYGTEIPDETKIYGKKYPDYLRLDFTVGIKLNGKKTTQDWSFYVQNATNRKNVFQQKYNQQRQEIETTYQIGLLPVLQYRIEF